MQDKQINIAKKISEKNNYKSTMNYPSEVAGRLKLYAVMEYRVW